MTTRRNDRPGELRDRDRGTRTLYEDLYHEERTARERLAAVLPGAASAALAWGLTVGYAVTPSANGWIASALGACALVLHVRALRAARRHTGMR